MNNKWYFISSVIQLSIGLIGTIAFIILSLNGERMTTWAITLLLAIAFMILGISGIINSKSK